MNDPHMSAEDTAEKITRMKTQGRAVMNDLMRQYGVTNGPLDVNAVLLLLACEIANLRQELRGRSL